MENQLPLPKSESKPAVPRTMLLVERLHYTFETWFIRQFQLELLPERFTIKEMREEYIKLCWKEELLWKEWNNA